MLKYNSLHRMNAVENLHPDIMMINVKQNQAPLNYLYVTTCDAQQNYVGAFYEV